jgi:hypothetical protein
MQITIAVVLCHSLGAIPSPVCREEIIVKDDMSMHACIISQAAIADWKEKTIFRGDSWKITRIKCIPGDYSPRGAI